MKRLYLYYDMKLVAFDIDEEMSSIVQFPVVHQIETVEVPIIDLIKNSFLDYIRSY